MDARDKFRESGRNCRGQRAASDEAHILACNYSLIAAGRLAPDDDAIAFEEGVSIRGANKNGPSAVLDKEDVVGRLIKRNYTIELNWTALLDLGVI
jgi:hypothetical protein